MISFCVHHNHIGRTYQYDWVNMIFMWKWYAKIHIDPLRRFRHRVGYTKWYHSDMIFTRLSKAAYHPDIILIWLVHHDHPHVRVWFSHQNHMNLLHGICLSVFLSNCVYLWLSCNFCNYKSYVRKILRLTCLICIAAVYQNI